MRIEGSPGGKQGPRARSHASNTLAKNCTSGQVQIRSCESTMVVQLSPGPDFRAFFSGLHFMFSLTSLRSSRRLTLYLAQLP